MSVWVYLEGLYSSQIQLQLEDQNLVSGFKQNIQAINIENMLEYSPNNNNT